MRVKIRLFSKILGTLTLLWRNRAHPHVSSLSERLAQDAGIAPDDIARQQIRHPSQHNRHPRL